MAQKRQKPDPHFGHFGPRYDIDTSFGGMENKYSRIGIPEGIEMLKGDIADLGRKYWRSTQKEENQRFKYPPLPLSWMRILMKPEKGLYEAIKKSPLQVSEFTTQVGGKSRRDLLLKLFGKAQKYTKAELAYLRKLDDSKLHLGWQMDKFFKEFMKNLGKKKKSRWEKAKKVTEIEPLRITKKPPGKQEGGRIGFDDGGPSQKEIDKALESIEKLKSSLMPESYEELIEIYKDKQKDLNIDIMESAGGLGDLLGEGGRAGFTEGLLVGPTKHLYEKLYESPMEKIINILNAPKNAALKIDEKIELVKKWIKEKTEKTEKAKGGRVGMMYGGDPGFAFSYGGSWADWKDNHASEMPLMDYINQKLPKARHPFSDAKYQSGGPVHDLDGLIQMYMEEGLSHEEAVQAAQATSGLDMDISKKAKGGRIGLANGTTMDAFESMTPNRKYMMTGESDVQRIMPPMGGILPIAGAGIFALSQKDKDKKIPQKKEGPNYPEPKPPFKVFDSIVDFILANRRQPKPSEEGRLKEIIRVAKEKAEGITSLFNENLHGINTQRFIEGAKEAPQKLLEDKVTIDDKTYLRSDKTRPPTEEELEDDYAELWNEEQSPWDFGSTIEELDAALEEHYAYAEQMRREYYSGALDKYVKPEELEKQRLSRQKKIDKVLAKAYDEVFYQKPASGDYKYDADVLADSIAEQLGKEPFDELPVTHQRQIYDSALKRVQQDLSMKKDLKEIEQKMKLSDFDVKDRKKNADGGSVGYPPLQPGEKPQGPFYETNNPNEAFKEILRRNLGSGITRAQLPAGFSLDAPYGPNQKFDLGVGFNTNPMSSGFSAGYGVNLDGNDTMGAGYNSPGGTFSMGVNKQEGSDPQWNFQKKWKFAKGGKAWRPKSAPKLTTTIPPERGPTPQGLTYLTGDDIVQNIG